MSLVSVVVPVYQAEAFLCGCIDAIRAQTYRNLEILLVDDGSPDGCPEICDRYGRVDDRIRVIHQKNGGASAARNAGIAAATGKYLCFADSDDIMAGNGIACLVNAMTSMQAQYAAGICGILHSQKVKNPIQGDCVIDFESSPEELLQYLIRPGSYSPYAKLFDLEIIRRENIRFDTELKCSEDALFVRQYLKHCQKMVLCAQVVYRYNTANDASLSRKGYEDYSLYFEKKLYALRELLAALPVSGKVQADFLASRAAAGLYGSVSHYCAHDFHGADRQLIRRAARQLRPWFSARGQVDPAYLNARIHGWYQTYAPYLAAEDLSKAVSLLQREGKYRAGKNRLRAWIKKRINWS